MITRNILQLDNKSGNFFTKQNYLKKNLGAFCSKQKSKQVYVALFPIKH